MCDTADAKKVECKKHEGIQEALGCLRSEIAGLDNLIAEIKGTTDEDHPVSPDENMLVLGSFLSGGREIIEGYAKSVGCAVAELRKLLFY